MKIRSMRRADFPGVYRLWQDTGLNVVGFARERKEIFSVIQKNRSSCFVLTDKENIVGTILGAFNGRRAWIYHLAIHPNCQKKGYGSLLLQKTEKALKNLGATKILLGVWLNNKDVLNYYQRRGYAIMNDSYILEKDLWYF